MTEDHQTHNAMALVRKDAGMIVTDAQARETLMGEACTLAKDSERTETLERNIARLAKTDAAQEIVDEIYKLL